MSSKKPIRVLQMLPGSHVLGGIETLMMEYYRNIDRTRVQFDFVFHYAEPSPIEEEALELGARIHHFTVREDGKVLDYRRQLHDFLSNENYNIMHGHMPGLAPIYFDVARRTGVKWRIAHSHVTATEPTPKGLVLRQVMRLIKYGANVRYACSNAAGKFMYGNMPFEVVRNAIDIERFAYNETVRIEIRKALGVDDDTLVVGHVGRFNPQKNHAHLVRSFCEVKRRKPDSVLVLAGDGPLEGETKSLATSLGISDSVYFFGRCETPEYLYQAMDVFILPSLFEGLGIACVEAQCSGLPCVVSTEVTEEAKLSESFSSLQLKDSHEAWAEEILRIANERKPREDGSRAVADAGYDIRIEACRLQERYETLDGGAE